MEPIPKPDLIIDSLLSLLLPLEFIFIDEPETFIINIIFCYFTINMSSILQKVQDNVYILHVKLVNTIILIIYIISRRKELIPRYKIFPERDSLMNVLIIFTKKPPVTTDIFLMIKEYPMCVFQALTSYIQLFNNSK